MVLLFLSGCQSVSIAPAVEPEVASISPTLKAECAPLTNVPKQPTAKQMADGWIIDRVNFGDCRRKHKALANAATALENQFGGPK